jgi:hypothetical protein
MPFGGNQERQRACAGRVAMRTHCKRLFLGGLVGIVAMVCTLQAEARTRGFDTEDLSGEYVGLITGKFGPDATDAVNVVRLVADGKGTLTLEQKRNLGQGIVSPPILSCDYAIEASGFGTITCPNGTSATLLLSDGGEQFALILGGSNVLAGHFSRQSRSGHD